MSYRVVNLYEVWCDGVTRPGTDDELPCDAEPSDELVWDEETADEHAVDNGWQLIVDATGSTRHYCPDHIHATCAGCGCVQVGNIDELQRSGWQDAKYDYALCPQCAARKAVM